MIIASIFTTLVFLHWEWNYCRLELFQPEIYFVLTLCYIAGVGLNGVQVKGLQELLLENHTQLKPLDLK